MKVKNLVLNLFLVNAIIITLFLGNLAINSMLDDSSVQTVTDAASMIQNEIQDYTVLGPQQFLEQRELGVKVEDVPEDKSSKSSTSTSRPKGTSKSKSSSKGKSKKSPDTQALGVPKQVEQPVNQPEIDNPTVQNWFPQLPDYIPGDGYQKDVDKGPQPLSGMCVSDSQCDLAENEICNKGLGLCIDLDNGHVPGDIQIVDIQSSICNGGLVNITVRGVYPIKSSWASDYFDFPGIATFLPWVADCFTNYEFSNYKLYNAGQTYQLQIVLVENDPPNIYPYESFDDLIAQQVITITTSVGIEDNSEGSCFALPFEYTFQNVNLGPLASETFEGNTIEVWAAAIGYPNDALEHNVDIAEPSGEDDSWMTGETNVDVIDGDCISGDCCDVSTCNYRLSSYTCDQDVQTDYGCPWGTNLGDDVGVHTADRHCSGASSSCDGSFVWGGWNIQDNCNGDELCIDDNPNCQFVDCSSNSECGTDGWLGSDYCNVDDVWDDWRTWTCNSPGIPSSSCSPSDNAQLKHTCPDTCSAGACAGITCYNNAECGTDAWVGSDFCSGDDIWNTWRTHTCSNPGTISSSCSASDTGQLKQTCTDTCSAGSCADVECYTNTECGTNAWVGSDYCNVDDVWNTWRTWTCNNPGTASASCSNSDNGQLKQTCADTCSAGACAGIDCYNNADCGTDSWVGSDYCNVDDVWNTWRAYTCTDPGTASASCSSSDNSQLKQTCGETCSAGSCAGIECYNNAECGTDAWLNNDYCNVDDVWDDWRTYTCNSPGTASASCSNSDAPQLKQTCGETCSAGACAGIECYNNAECGTDAWLNNNYCNVDDIWDDWRTYTCNNPGTASASCSNSDAPQLKQTCADTCSAGSCVGIECYNGAECGTSGFLGNTYCNGDDVWDTWRSFGCINSGTPSSYCTNSDAVFLKETCTETCSAGVCVGIDCYNNDQCGTNAWVGSDYCNGDDIWDNWKTYTCNNPGTASAYCSNSDAPQLKQTCPEVCSAGSCVGVVCYNNAECGTDQWVGSDYCNSNNIWGTWRTYTCNNPGTASASCSSSDNGQLIQTCPETCSAGACQNAGYLWHSEDGLFDNKIYKLTQGGTLVDSFDSPAGTPRALTWDGTYLWHADTGVDKIYKLTQDGTVVDSFNSPGTYPTGLTWDGSYLWHADTDMDRIYKLTTTGSIVDSFNSPSIDPQGLTWDGTYLWNSDGWDGKIYKLTTTGSVVDSFSSPPGSPRALTWDGTYLLHADAGNDRIYKLTTTGSVADSFDYPYNLQNGLAWQPGTETIGCYDDSYCPSDIWQNAPYCNADDVWDTLKDWTCVNPATPSSACTSSDTAQLIELCVDVCEAGSCKDVGYLWNSDRGTDKIYKLLTNGTVLSSFNSPSNNPGSLAWDGAYLWNVDTNSDEIFKLTTNGTIVDSFDSPDGGPNGIAWDGTYLWNSGSVLTQLIYKLTTTGSVVDSFTPPGIMYGGLTWDGSNLWHVNVDNNKIYKLTTTGSTVGSFDSPTPAPSDLAFDGLYLWNVNIFDDKIYKMTTAGVIIDSFDSPGSYPSGLTWQPGSETIECYDDSYCGTDVWMDNLYCNGDDVWDTLGDWTCVNPATPSSSCSYAEVGVPRNICAGTCNAGSCTAVWNTLTDKNIDEDSSDGIMIYAGLRTECNDSDSPEFITIMPHDHYDLYFDGDDLKIMNLDPDLFSVEAVDLYCNGVAASFDLTINNLNDGITLNPIPDITVNETDLVQVIPSVIDIDNDTLTFSFESPLDSSGEWLTTFADAGTYILDVTVDDGNGETDTKQVTINVLDLLMPDLAITSSKVLTPTPTVGQWTTFQIIVENIGDFASDIYWIFDTDSPEINPSYGPFDLESGKAVDIYPVVKYTSAGTYNPVFTVDYNNTIEERDESNNQVIISLTLS